MLRKIRARFHRGLPPSFGAALKKANIEATLLRFDGEGMES